MAAFPPTGSAPVGYWRDADLGLEGLRGVFRGVAFARHAHPEYVVALVTDGALLVATPRGERVAHTGDLVVLNGGEAHGGRDDGRGWRYDALYPSAAALRDAARAVGLPGDPHFPEPVVRDPRAADALAAYFADGLAAPPDERAARVAGALAGLVARHARPRSAPAAPAPPGIRRALALLHDRWAEDLPLARLADEAGLGLHAFPRAFRRATGLGPHQYLAALRVTRARALLARGESVAQVALATGFYDQSHLNRVFKSRVGVPPGRYREAFRRSPDAAGQP